MRRFFFWLAVVAGGLGLVFSACAYGLRQPTAELTSDPTPPVVTRVMGEVTVHVFHTGWVSVKEAHRTLAGSDWSRMSAILVDRRWTEWMPTYAFAIVQPRGGLAG